MMKKLTDFNVFHFCGISQVQRDNFAGGILCGLASSELNIRFY